MLVLPGRDEGGGVDRHVPGGGSVRRYVHHPHQGHHGHRRLLCRLAAQRCFQPHQLLYVRSAILVPIVLVFIQLTTLIQRFKTF